MPMGGGGNANFAGPGSKFSNFGPVTHQSERPKFEDPRQKEFGDVFSIAKTKLKDRV
jgi:hypothetical protein